MYFLSREDSEKVLAACPDAEWRLIFALSRFGGLRCPSEHLALRWGDVDWEHNRMTVHSSKTEHYEGTPSTSPQDDEVTQEKATQNTAQQVHAEGRKSKTPKNITS